MSHISTRHVTRAQGAGVTCLMARVMSHISTRTIYVSQRGKRDMTHWRWAQGTWLSERSDMSHGMSHVAHFNTYYIRVRKRHTRHDIEMCDITWLIKQVMSHISMRRDTCAQGAGVTCLMAWVMSHISTTRHDSLYKSCHTFQCVMSRVPKGLERQVSSQESCRTFHCVMSRDINVCLSLLCRLLMCTQREWHTREGKRVRRTFHCVISRHVSPQMWDVTDATKLN